MTASAKLAKLVLLEKKCIGCANLIFDPRQRKFGCIMSFQWFDEDPPEDYVCRHWREDES